ncbi:hypothetical protein PS15m_002832 [Mucor circinelloides]
MKLSFSLALLAAAAISVQAAVTPNAASSCVAGSSGLGNGDGYNGYCCKTSDDCFDSCVKGVCNGPTKPTKPTKTSTAQPSSTPGTCTAGSSGLGKGDGYKGYCCKTSDDCFESCVKGVCNGPTKTTTPTKTSTTPTPTGTPGTCTAGSSGLGKGDGYKGYCCKTSDDCFESCVKGVCNGPTKTNTPTKTSTTPTPTGTSGTCTAGSSGLGKGDGYKGYCCKTSDDCFESCVKGVCNGPSNTKSPTPVPTGTNCKPGYKGLGNGEGPANACCDDSDDCQESCISGKCN